MTTIYNILKNQFHISRNSNFIYTESEVEKFGNLPWGQS